MFKDIEKYKRPSEVPYKYSLLIPTWNNLEYLKLCIGSIRKNSSFKHQIIIIVNDGSDGTIQWVKAQTDVDYVASSENMGICYGLNAARSLIASDYLVYINDDMYLLPGWDSGLSKEIEVMGHANFILSGTMIEPNDTGNACVVVRNYGTDLKTFNEEQLLNDASSITKNDWLGSTWPPIIMPVDLWDMVGGMSVEFSPGMYSDPDLSMKLWHAGVRVFKGVGSSKVYHFGSKSTKRGKMNNGAKLFLKKWGVPSGLFLKKYLRRGDEFHGQELIEPKLNLLNRLKIKYKVIYFQFFG